MSDSIELPDLPTDIDFEDLIAAEFQLSGYFLERNIIERGEAEVLELDIVKTSYRNEIPELEMIEVKSGKWGFNEVFKLRGWMTYLNQEVGHLIIKQKREEFGFIFEKAKLLNIKLTQTDGDAKKPNLIEIDDATKDEIDAWRYSYWIERELIKIIKVKKKENRESKCYQVASDYYQHLSGGIYFNDTVAEKLDNLYRWHTEHPNLSASTSNEIENGEFTDKNGILKKHFKSTFYDCEINEIQATSFIEYKAKLQILKNAVDFSLYQQSGEEAKADKIEFQLGDMEFWKSNSLPYSFHNGIEYLRAGSNYKLYPILWSYYIFVFGGYILKDYQSAEYSYLEKRTGVPISEIDYALKAFDIFFPSEKGWFVETDKVRLLKIFPSPLRGVGTNFRKDLFLKENEEYLTLGSHDKRTVSDLLKWNNCGYFLLKGEY